MKVLVLLQDKRWKRKVCDMLKEMREDEKEMADLQVFPPEGTVEPLPDPEEMVKASRADLILMDWGDGRHELLGTIRTRYQALDPQVWVLDENPRELHHLAAKADLILDKALFSPAILAILVWRLATRRGHVTQAS